MSASTEPEWQCGANVLTLIPRELGAGLRVRVPWPAYQEEPVSTWIVSDLPMDAAEMIQLSTWLRMMATILMEERAQQ